MKLSIEAHSKLPIYVQIEQQVRALVAAGRLRPGDQLPTIRQLATDLRVNYNTVARAYLDLDREGVISTQQGRGTFVAGLPEEHTARSLRDEKLRSILRSSLEEARHLGYEAGEITAVLEGELAQWLEENGRSHQEEKP